MRWNQESLLGLMLFASFGAALSAVPNGVPYRWLKVLALGMGGYIASAFVIVNLGVLPVAILGGFAWVGFKVYAATKRRGAARPEAQGAQADARVQAPSGEPSMGLRAPPQATQPAAIEASAEASLPAPIPAPYPRVQAKPARGVGWRLYLSAQIFAVAGIVLLALPFWVVRLHDRAVSRGAMRCWQDDGDMVKRHREYAARVAPLLYPALIQRPCSLAAGCGEQYLTALETLGETIPGTEQISRCRMRAGLDYRLDSRSRAYDDDAALSCRGADIERVGCQLGYFLSLAAVAPYDLWDTTAETEDGNWSAGSTSGDSLVSLVFTLYPEQAASATALLAVPLVLYGLRRWVLWIAGKVSGARSATQPS